MYYFEFSFTDLFFAISKAEEPIIDGAVIYFGHGYGVWLKEYDLDKAVRIISRKEAIRRYRKYRNEIRKVLKHKHLLNVELFDKIDGLAFKICDESRKGIENNILRAIKFQQEIIK